MGAIVKPVSLIHNTLKISKWQKWLSKKILNKGKKWTNKAIFKNSPFFKIPCFNFPLFRRKGEGVVTYRDFDLLFIYYSATPLIKYCKCLRQQENTTINKAQFEEICPALVQQLESESCVNKNSTSEKKSEDTSSWKRKSFSQQANYH